MLRTYEVPAVEREAEEAAHPIDLPTPPTAGPASTARLAGPASTAAGPAPARPAGPAPAVPAGPAGRWSGDRRVALRTTAIAAGMVVVAAVLCTGVPFLALHLASLAPATGQPAAGALIFMAALAGGVAACWWVLALLQASHSRLTGGRVQRARRGWQKPQSDDRGRRPSTLLEVVMTWCVILAAVAMGVWYFGFADAYPIIRR